VRKFYVFKESGTFSDTLEFLGLVRLIKNIFQNDFFSIIMYDKGTFYQLELEKEIDLEKLTIDFFYLFRYITKKNEDGNTYNFPIINYDTEKEIVDKYYKLKSNERKKEETPKPHKDYDIIRLLSGINGYRVAFNNWLQYKDNFNDFLKFLLEYYSQFDIFKRDDLYKDFNKKYTMKNLEKINALQDINPDKGKGINKTKANSVTPNAYSKILWFKQLLKFAGLWEGGISKYFNKDYKTYVITPFEINYNYFSAVFNDIKTNLSGKTSIKFDIIIQLNLIEKLIYHHKNYTENWNIFEPKRVISGIQFAYYKNLGQRPAVTNIGFLGIPQIMKVKNEEDGNKWIEVIKEHKNIIGSINDSHSSNIEMLINYREFMSSGNFKHFFEFCFGYGTYLISKDKLEPYMILTKNRMEVLFMSETNFNEILENEGFKAIANAIRNSTIKPATSKDPNAKKNIVFGLSNKLKIASRNKELFVEEIANFVKSYNEKNMLSDYHGKEHHKYITDEEFKKFVELIDNSNISVKTIAGLLVAYGYTREKNKE